MQFIYARTSTIEQNVDQQVAFLKNIWQDATVYAEKMTGYTLDRPALQELEQAATMGDSILVLSVSRLGRRTTEVLHFIERMKHKGVAVHVHDLGMLDVTSSTGKVVLSVLASVAEMNREEMLEKQRIGIERAKGEGKYKGRQVSPETVKKCEKALHYINTHQLPKEAAAKAAGVGVATLYRYIKRTNQNESCEQ